MATVSSSPATFNAASGTPAAVTFAIPAGVIWTSASFTLAGNQNIDPGLAASYQFNWNVSGEHDFFTGTTTVLAYSGTAPVSTGGLSDINAGAGGNAGGTITYTSAIPTFVLAVTSFVLTITGVIQVQSNTGQYTEQQQVVIAIPF